MEKRYQIRVGAHKVDFRYDADTQTWRARRPGTQDYTTGQAGTLEAARDAVRRYIQDEEPTAESLHPQASRPVPGPSRYWPWAGWKRPDPATGARDRERNPIPSEARGGACRYSC